MKRFAVAAIVSLSIIGVSAAVTSTGAKAVSTGSASSSSYCANRGAIFRDGRPFVGIYDVWADNETTPQRDCTFGRMAANHIGYFREWLSWPVVEYAPNHYDFRLYDGLTTDLARHHLRLLPMLLGTPSWRSHQSPHMPPGAIRPPQDPKAFASFAALCAERYGPHGTFWRSHPAVPYYPVQAWEIWNEPNLAQYWAPKPDLRAYVRLLRDASSAIKHVDPRATIVAAGMPFFSAAATTTAYTELYRDGARGAFDAIGFHGYSATLSGMLDRLRAARAVMNRFGDRKKPIWLTEWGWAGGPPNVFKVNWSGQRAMIAASLSMFERYRAQLGLQEVMYFDWADRDDGYKSNDWYGFRLGLFSDQLQPKPALAAFSTAAARLNR